MIRFTSVVSAVFVLLALVFPQTSLAEVVLMPKQLIILKPGTDRVLGTWVAAVNNHGTSPETFSVPVLMPRDVKDFQAIEGVTSEEIQLGQAGLVVQKSFPPGVSVLSIGFMMPASSGQTNLHLKTVAEVGELTVMAPRGLLDIHSVDLSEAGSDVQDMQRYSIWTSNRMIVASQDLVIGVSGIPEGRTKLWIIGGLLGAILVGGVIFLAMRTAPRIQSDNKNEFA